nr:unnamed protein product [Callosobruchus analis]
MIMELVIRTYLDWSSVQRVRTNLSKPREQYQDIQVRIRTGKL